MIQFFVSLGIPRVDAMTEAPRNREHTRQKPIGNLKQEHMPPLNHHE